MSAGFDVFVIGPPVTAGEANALVTALAGKLGLSATAVAQGLAERKLCAGSGLEPTAAQVLTRDLRALGAVALMRASAPAASRAAPAPPPSPRPAAAPTAKPTLSFGGGGDQISLPDAGSLSLTEGIPLDGPTGADPFTPPPASGPSLGFPEPPGAVPSAAMERPRADPFGPPPSSPALGAGLDLEAPAAPPRTAARPARPAPAAAIAMADDPVLELATAGPARSSDEFRRSPRTMGGAAALNHGRLAASSSGSGLAVDSEAAAGAYRVTCGKHGLMYDSRKASGCGKCLEPGRKLSAALKEQDQPFKLFELDEDNPAKRAFIGLAVALVVGFVPAAYHALRMGSQGLHRLREEQEVLSRKPAAQEIVQRFEEIETTIGNVKSRSMRNTGIIWLVVGGGTLLAWYRVT